MDIRANESLSYQNTVLAPVRELETLPKFDPLKELDSFTRSNLMYFLELYSKENSLQDLPEFQVVSQRFDRHVVIPDLHGENRILERVIEKYQREDTGFVFLGDLIDRKGNIEDIDSVPKLLNTILDLGDKAIICLANHELILLGALSTKDPLRRYAYSFYYDIIKAHTLSDYGIPNDRFDWNKEELTERMNELGHLALLRSSTPYYETDKFIATHAGINHRIPWQIEKEKLDDLSLNLSKGDYPDPFPRNGVQLEDGLEPIFSIKNAIDTSPIKSTSKIIVSGHAHSLHGSKVMGLDLTRNPMKSRKILEGQRIRLASQLNRPKNDDLFIWQDWDQEIVVIPNRR